MPAQHTISTTKWLAARFSSATACWKPCRNYQQGLDAKKNKTSAEGGEVSFT